MQNTPQSLRHHRDIDKMLKKVCYTDELLKTQANYILTRPVGDSRPLLVKDSFPPDRLSLAYVCLGIQPLQLRRQQQWLLAEGQRVNIGSTFDDGSNNDYWWARGMMVLETVQFRGRQTRTVGGTH